MRHHFEDSLNMNVLNWKINRRIRTLQKAEFLSKITSFFAAKIWIRKLYISNPKYFIYLLWPWRILVFKCFAKIMGGNYVFCCSNCISFNPTSNSNYLILVGVFHNSFSYNFQLITINTWRCYVAKQSHLILDPSCVSRCCIWFR